MSDYLYGHVGRCLAGAGGGSLQWLRRRFSAWKAHDVKAAPAAMLR